MLLPAMACGSRIPVLEMTAGSRATARSSAAMDAQEINQAGMEMTARSRTPAGVYTAMDLQEQDCDSIVLSYW